MVIDIVLLITGLFLLIYGADILVKGASSLAAYFKMPNIVIGLTVIAIGTSAPELVINVLSSLEGESSLVFGNVLGSNIFNIMCVLGITAIVFPIAISKTTTRIEIPLVLISSLLILFMFLNETIGSATYVITKTEGLILLVLFLSFICYTVLLSLKAEKGAEKFNVKLYTLPRSAVYILFGLSGLFFGGRFLVDSAVSIAESIGIPQRIIAITIISIGTSLPELATSIAAARNKKIDMAVGNVIGSNLMNVFLVLGISAFISPISLSIETLSDIMFNILASLSLLLFAYVGKTRKIERWEGILMVLMYTAYIIYLIINI